MQTLRSLGVRVKVWGAQGRGRQVRPSQHELLVKADHDFKKFERVEWKYGNGLPETYAQLKLLDWNCKPSGFTSSIGWHTSAGVKETLGSRDSSLGDITTDDLLDPAKLQTLPLDDLNAICTHIGLEGISSDLNKEDIVHLLGVVFETATPPAIAEVWQSLGSDTAELFYLANLGGSWRPDSLLACTYRDPQLLRAAVDNLLALLPPPGPLLHEAEGSSAAAHAPCSRSPLLAVLTREPQAILLGHFPEALARRLMQLQSQLPAVDVREVWEAFPEAIAGTYEAGQSQGLELAQRWNAPGSLEPHLDELQKLAVRWREETPWEATWGRPQPYMSPCSGDGGARLQRFVEGQRLRRQYQGHLEDC